MSRMTKEINKITGAVIGVSGKLIIYALVILLLYEGVTRGFSFGYSIFYSTGVAPEPGIEKQVVINEEDTVQDIAAMLKEKGLINSESVFVIQSLLYGYGKSGDHDIKAGTFVLNNSTPSKEIVIELRDGPEEKETKE